jgi:hypothetical protein
MKILKKDILQILAATIFSVALLLPTAVSFAHSFDGHEHKACTDLSTHLHEKQLDCSICDFHFSIFNFTPQQLPEFVVFHIFESVETEYLLPEFSLNSSHYFLRGPPLFS